MAKIIKIQDIPVGDSRLAVSNNNDFINQDNASTLLSSYTRLTPLQISNIITEIVISGIPFSISCFETPLSNPSIGGNGIFYALDVIENPNFRDAIVYPNTETFVLNGNRLSMTKIDGRFYWQMEDIGSNSVFKDNIVLSGIPLGRGNQNELILHLSDKTYGDIEKLKEVIIGGMALTLGRINNKYYLIIKSINYS